MKKKYTVIPTKKQLAVMKEGWKRFQEIQNTYHRLIFHLEAKLSKETGIKDLEFFRIDKCPWCRKEIFEDGVFCGIGNVDRTLKLLQREELEK